MKQFQRISIIKFSKDIDESLKKPLVRSIRPFAYYKNGFSKKKLRIFLSNVPLYDTNEDDPVNLIPSETSGISFCYISTSDFLKWKNKMVEIYIDDTNNHYRKKYVKFDDLHIINKDLFVKDTLALSEIKYSDLERIDEIERNIKRNLKQRRNKKFKRKIIFSLIKDNLIRNSIEYVTYAYTHFRIH